MRSVWFFGVIVIVGVLLAGVETKLMWGFWWTPASFDRVIDSATSVKSFDVVSISDGTLQVLPDAGDRMIRYAAIRCDHNFAGCGMQRLAVSAERQFGSGRSHVSERFVEKLWRVLRDSDEYHMHWHHLEAKGKRPVEGVVVVFQKGDSEQVIVALRTSELWNDKYQFGEWLFDVGNNGVEVRSAHSYLYDDAGLELFTWQVLSIVNGGLLLFAAVPVLLLRRKL